MKLIAILGAVILSAALTIIAAHEKWFGLSLAHEVNVVDLLTLAVTVLIGFVLQDYFAAKATDSRAEKNILIDDLSRVIATLHDCRDAVLACHDERKISPANKRMIVHLLRQLSNGIETLESTLELTQCSAMTNKCRTLRDDYFRYKVATSGGAFPEPYSVADLNEQENAYRSFSKDLKSFVFQINAYH